MSLTVGRAAFGQPSGLPTPPSGGPIETRMIPASVTADIRARAYELARAELPSGASRLMVMAVADEIFAYLMHGRKP